MASYRNDASVLRIRKGFLLFAFVGLGVGAFGLTRLAAGRATSWGSIASAALVVIGVAGLLLARRTARVSVETGSESIEIRNVASTRRFAWSEVEAFEDIPRPRAVAQVQIRTRSGKTYPITACGEAGPTGKRIVRFLNAELRAARRD